MRLIGEIDNLDHAKTFVAHLRTEGITSHLEQEGGVWEIWVKEEDSLVRAAEELDAFQQNPSDAKYRAAVDRANRILQEEEQRRQRIQKNIVNVSSGGMRKSAPLVMLLIVLSGLVTLLTNFGDSKGGAAYRAMSFVAVNPPESIELVTNNDLDSMKVRLASVYRGEIWRLFTPMFVHFDGLHIVFNMVWLFYFGRLIENRYGTFWFALIVLATAGLSALAQGIVPARLDGTPPGLVQGDFLISPFGGMSGVVYGLFGFVWVKSYFDRSSGFYIAQSTVIILVAWLFFCISPLSEEMFNLHVANWAHGAGLVVGMIAGYLPTMYQGGGQT